MPNFKTICRTKRIPKASLKAGLIKEISGVNKLEVKNEADGSHLYLSGSVGGSWFDDDGITEAEVLEALNGIPKGQKIHAHINSEGGSVQEGLGIYNAFKARSEDITAHIDGYALSIASVIPLAASKVVSPKSAIWMMHCASCGDYGNANEKEKTVEMLREHDDMLSEIYAEHTGKPAKDCYDDMAKETWIRGSQAVEYGLADCSNDDEGETEAKFKPLPAALLARMKNIPANIFNMLGGKTEPENNSAALSQGGQPKPQPKENTMKKDKIVALLKKHGIEAKEDWSDEQFETALATLATSTDVSAKLEAIQAQQELAKRQRITDKIEAYIGKKITKDVLNIYVEAGLRNEKETIEAIEKLPDVTFGGSSAGLDITVREESKPPGLSCQARHLSPKLKAMAEDCGGDKLKLYASMKGNMPLLVADAAKHDGVRNENTFSSSLTTNFLILGATVLASPKFASVGMFSRDTSIDPYKPLATGELKLNTTVQDGSTSQTNATNFESGDSTVTNVAVTVAQYTESFHITNGQLNSGLRMEDLVTAKLASLGSKISKVLATNITAANFATLSPIIRSAGSFGFSDMQTLWGQLKKANRKNVMLDGPYLAKLINIPTLFQPTPVVPGASWKNLIGWDFVALHTEWSAAGNNIIGFGCDPQALGVIAGLPLIDSPAIPGGILAQASGMLPGVDLAIAAYAWFNTSTRTYWASYDMMFGANALDTTIGNVIASGTPS